MNDMNVRNQGQDQDQEIDTQLKMFEVKVWCHACRKDHALVCPVLGEVVRLSCCIGEVRPYTYARNETDANYHIYRNYGAGGYHHPECPCDTTRYHSNRYYPEQSQEIPKKL